MAAKASKTPATEDPERARNARDALLKRLRERDRSAGVGPDERACLNICQALAFASNPLRASVRAVAASYDLGPRGAWILNLVNAGIVQAHEFATIFNATRSVISGDLVRLTEAGLIEGRPRATDRRNIELRLTEAGDTALEEMRRALVQRIAPVLSS